MDAGIAGHREIIVTQKSTDSYEDAKPSFLCVCVCVCVSRKHSLPCFLSFHFFLHLHCPCFVPVTVAYFPILLLAPFCLHLQLVSAKIRKIKSRYSLQRLKPPQICLWCSFDTTNVSARAYKEFSFSFPMLVNYQVEGSLIARDEGYRRNQSALTCKGNKYFQYIITILTFYARSFTL